MYYLIHHNKMKKKIAFIISFFLVTFISYSQKKEKIKGSKIVTVSINEIPDFENVEVFDNFELYLIKSEKPSIEIEADDNLHEIINYEVKYGTLKITSQKEVSSSKKFSLRVYYTNTLKLITAKNETKIYALAEIDLDNFTIKNYDNSKSYLNVKSIDFALFLNDKSRAEVNVNSINSSIEISKNSELKALVNSNFLKLDMYQKSKAEIEGNIQESKLRLDNSTLLIAKKLINANLKLTIEHNAKCLINVLENFSLSASDKSVIELYGKPKIQLEKFLNNSTLQKKEN